MFSLLFIQYLNLDNRTRRLAGISVVFVCALICGIIFLNVAYFDRLNRYAAKDTYFYFHLNRSADSFYQIKIIDALLDNFRLDGIDRHWLGSELALICQVRDNHDFCELIMAADKAKPLEAYLIANKTPYKKLSGKDFAIAASPAYLASIKKNHSIFLRQKYQSAPGQNGQLTAVINAQKNLTGNIARLFAISGYSRAKLYGHADNNGLSFSPSTLPLIKNDIGDSASSTCDFFLASTASAFNKSIGDYLSVKYPGSEPLNLPESAAASLCVDQINATGNPLNDYKFSLRLDTAPTDSLMTNLDKNISAVLKQAHPTEKTIYMGGKDRVTLLYANNTYASSSAALNPAQNGRISVNTTTQVIMISNVDQPQTQPTGINLFIKTSIINVRPLNQLFSHFYQLQVGGQYLLVK